eukprot:m.173881 g.173881  ORF g.173881 m.173881 type:complete len:90 (-) comp53281_c0_seq5:1319-1588(-)
MAGRALTGVRELRLIMCQTSQASAGLREFVQNSFVELKRVNPALPVLVREAAGVPAQLHARYAFGVEKHVNVDNASSAQVSEAVRALSQ